MGCSHGLLIKIFVNNTFMKELELNQKKCLSIIVNTFKIRTQNCPNTYKLYYAIIKTQPDL